jgi:membrane-associated phospholipid phosphatase
MRSFVKTPALPIFALLIFALYPVSVFSQEQNDEETMEEMYRPVPLSTIFHDIGGNALHSLVFNYGANFAAAGLGTWLFVESGLDWQWRNFAYDHEPLANGAYAAVIYAGWALPFATPVGFYLAGLFAHDEKLQIAGMALVQSMALANGFHAIFKLSTGRSEPYIISQYHHERINTSDDFSGDFDWFKMALLDGWPSGHTLSAFATAATIAQLYSDNLPLKIAVFSYAAIVGLGVSLNVHWASDVLAGALMGYAVGTTVGISFRQLLRPEAPREKISFSLTAQPLGILVRF